MKMSHIWFRGMVIVSPLIAVKLVSMVTTMPALSMNTCKVCIRATTWNIHNTEVRLKYYTGLSDVLVKVC